MKEKPFRIFNTLSHETLVFTKENAIKFLWDISQRDVKELYNYEIFDPTWGWSYSDNWLHHNTLTENDKFAVSA